MRKSAGLALALVLVGCGSSNPPTPTGVPVGPEGGVVASDGGLTLTIPEGALASSVEITVAALDTPPAFARGPAFRLGPEGQTFSVPVTVELPIDPNPLLPAGVERELGAFSAPAGSDAFEALELVDVTASSVIATTTHFSDFAGGMTAPAELASGEKYPRRVAAKGGYAYFTDAGSSASPASNGNAGFVVRAPLAGGAVEVLTPEIDDPFDVAVDGANAYFTSGGHGAGPSGGETGSAVYAVALAGGAPTKLADALYAQGIAVDATHVYYADADAGELRRVPIAGGASELVVAGVGVVEALAVDETHVFFASKSAGIVGSVEKAGAAAFTTLADGQTTPVSLSVDAEHVYWANEDGGEIQQAPKAGGAVTTVFAASYPGAVHVAGDALVFTDRDWQSVLRVPLAGGTPTVLADAEDVPWALASDGGTLVWVNAGFYELEGVARSLAL